MIDRGWVKYQRRLKIPNQDSDSQSSVTTELSSSPEGSASQSSPPEQTGLPHIPLTHTLFLRLSHEAYRNAVPQPRIEPAPLAVKAHGPNNWTTRESPPISLSCLKILPGEREYLLEEKSVNEHYPLFVTCMTVRKKLKPSPFPIIFRTKSQLFIFLFLIFFTGG